MLARRPAHLAAEAQEVPHHGHVAKGNPRLRHAERAGIHAEQEDFLGSLPVANEVGLGHLPGVVEGIVDTGDGRGKGEPADPAGKGAADRDQRVGRLHHALLRLLARCVFSSDPESQKPGLAADADRPHFP